MSDEHEETMSDPVRRATELLREDVPVRGAWRDALLARIDREAAPRGRVWTFRPAVAIAAGIVLLAVGVVSGRYTRDSSPRVVQSPAAETATVRFVFAAPRAAKVSLVGDFNRWDPAAVPLRRLGDGTWIADVPLAPGRYVYAFVVDGKIEMDPAAPRSDDGDFGANSVVMVRGS